MEKQETPGEQEQQKTTDMTWAGPARPTDADPAKPADAEPGQPADAGTSRPNGAAQSGRMELAAEPSPDLRHLPAGGLPQATTYAYPEPERVLLVAIFTDENAADDCAEELSQRGLDVAVRLLTDPNAQQQAGAQAGAQASQQASPRRLGGRVTLGATLGATAGLLASTFVVPEAATGVPSMLTTLVGAGLGSYWGRQAGGAGQQADAGAGGDKAAAQQGQPRLLLVARVAQDQADDVQDRILTWNPVEVRVQ